MPKDVVITTLRLRKRSIVQAMNWSVGVLSSMPLTADPIATLVLHGPQKQKGPRIPSAGRQTLDARASPLEGISRDGLLHTGAHIHAGARGTAGVEPERNG